MEICWLTESQYHSKFSYEQLLDIIPIALLFLSLNRVVYNRIYLALTAVYIHIYVYVFTVNSYLSKPWRRKWSGDIAPFILIRTLDRDEWSASPTGQFTSGRVPRNNGIVVYVGQSFVLGSLVKQKIRWTFRNSSPRPSVVYLLIIDICVCF